MTLPLSARLEESIPNATGLYHRLVLVAGLANSGKTRALTDLVRTKGWPRINVNLRIAERLLDLTQKQRAVRVAGLLDDIVKAASSEVVLLDNIEMLFAVELAQDPLRLLQGLSRNRTVVASWPGSFDGHTLTYAEPGHREFRKYLAPQAVIVTTVEQQPTDLAIAREETR
jgi:hypothetical protein